MVTECWVCSLAAVSDPAPNPNQRSDFEPDPLLKICCIPSDNV